MAKETIGDPIVVGGNVIPISKAVRVGDFVFLSGQVPFKDGAPMTTGTVEEQTHVVMGMIKAILADAGCTLDDVIKANCWLPSKGDFLGFNKVYGEYFPKDPPARSTVVSGLMVDVKLEVEVTAYKPR
ncbi:MAG: RidA family protein [Proteobacteria bacterium]|nr:RidA family protein [Pseudomonadota bacterium]